MLKQALLGLTRKRLVVLALLILSLCAVLVSNVGTDPAQARICCSACEDDPPPLPCLSGCSPSC
jgi:hypothetical protein